ncbi:transporter, partial [Glutamicibacter soli]|nr:transporter [Glutamicibacter soli]
SSAGTPTEIWLASNWLIWGVLWFMYFLLLALGRPILRPTAWVTLLAGIVTGWLPGFLLLDGLM